MIRALFTTLLLAACVETAPPIDNTAPQRVSDPLEITRILAADDMEGRAAGSPGNAKARAWLLQQMQARPFEPLVDDFEHAFEFTAQDGQTVPGVNLLGRIKGKNSSDGRVLLVTAHYDHVGMRGEDIFNGADDNASGVAGAFAIADHFFATPPTHDVVIAFLDAEEMGLRGAKAFLADEVMAPDEIGLNLNLDMISKNDKNELYAAGTYHTPALKPLLDAVAADAPVQLRLGHDRPELGADDWTLLADHAPFHQAGIPFVYFGVEDHADYHQPSDVFETIPQDFFRRSVETVTMAAEMLDEELSRLHSE